MKIDSLIRFFSETAKRNVRTLVQIAAIILVCCGHVVTIRAATPEIVIYRIPQLGKTGKAAGRVIWDELSSANASKYAVVAMIHAIWDGGGDYYVKPYYNHYLNDVDANGNFSFLITTGENDQNVDEVIFYFVERSQIKEADVRNPAAIAGKFLKNRTVFRRDVPDMPESNIKSGFIEAGRRITLSCQYGGVIRYTLDGSNPITSATAQTYSSAFTLPKEGALLIKAVVESKNLYSSIASLLWLLEEPLDTKFWGLNVSLALNGEQFEDNLTEETVRKRMLPVAKLTKWVKTFRTINIGHEYINKIAKELGLHTMIGVYITNKTADNNAQITGLQKILQTGPAPDLIVVGSETSLLNVSPATLVSYIDRVRQMVLSLGLKIPIGSVDIVNIDWDEDVLERIDFVGVNMYHGVWDNVPENQMISVSKQSFRNSVNQFHPKFVFLTETGAPYNGGQYSFVGGTQIASEKKAANYLKGFLDWTKQDAIPSFWFEAYDEPCKSQNGGHQIEQYFGIMDGNLLIHPFYKEIICSNEIELFLPELKLYPNPFTDFVQLQGADDCLLTVYTATGAAVHIQKITSPNETIRLDHLPAGNYIFNLEKKGRMKTVKILKL